MLLGVLIECPIFLWIYFDNQADIEGARTKLFLLFVFVELIIAVTFVSLRHSLFQAPPHKWLLLAMGWELALFVVLIQFAFVRETFGIRMPTWPDVGTALAVSAIVVAAIEATKAFLRATHRGRDRRARARRSPDGSRHPPRNPPPAIRAKGEFRRPPRRARLRGKAKAPRSIPAKPQEARPC